MTPSWPFLAETGEYNGKFLVVWRTVLFKPGCFPSVIFLAVYLLINIHNFLGNVDIGTLGFHKYI